jgi:hypothetical protein
VPPAADGAANAHSLVARVGPAPWFEARSFYEWRAGPEQKGVLVLASNAAAWTAGDAAAAWTITVEVRPTAR